MKKEKVRMYLLAAGLLAAFVVWTALVCCVDVAPIGPLGSTVGFAAMNGYVHSLTGISRILYDLTDLLSVVPLGFIAGFGLLGLFQWIHRKDIRKVDPSILVLGGFYAVVLGVFALFELVVINYRPVLISGRLEASYPSSTTMLVLCVMPTAVMQLKDRIRHRGCRRITAAILTAFTLLMVIGRLVSGVHWFSDIVGGVLLSGGLVMLYRVVCDSVKK